MFSRGKVHFLPYDFSLINTNFVSHRYIDLFKFKTNTNISTTYYYKKQKQRYEKRRNQTRFIIRQRKSSCIHERVTTPPGSVAMGWNTINASASKDHYYL